MKFKSKKEEIINDVLETSSGSISTDNMNFINDALDEIYKEFTNQSVKAIDEMIMNEVPTQLGWLKPKTFNEDGLPIDYDVEMVDNIDNLTQSQCLLFADVVSNETKQVERVMTDDEFTKKFYL